MDHRVQDIVVHPTVHVLVEADGDAWGAWVPAVPGVYATGRSEAEVTERIASALTFYFAEEHREHITEDARDPGDADVTRLAEEATATVTLAEAAQLAGVSLGAITNAIARGQLTATPAPAEAMPARGRRTRLVYRQEVEQWRNERTARLRKQLGQLTHA
jgi:predicted RNase H-like HicB family nuclease